MRNMKKWILGILFALLAAVMLQEPAGAYAEGEDINYFCIENVSGQNATVTWRRGMYGDPEIGLHYSYNKVDWEGPLVFENVSIDISLSAGGKVYFKNDTGKFNGYDDEDNLVGLMVTCDQSYNVSGDITTLLKGAGGVTDLTDTGFGVFACLFNASSTLKSAENLVLPATTLAEGCYYRMFNGCTSLKAAPALPATTLEFGCYKGMFLDCTSLKAAPALPATTLKRRCYEEMFLRCSSLNNIEFYATDISAVNCLDYWTDGVSLTGTFYKSSALSTETIGSGSGGIPTDWTVKNYSNISITEGIENGTVSTSLSLALEGVQVDVTAEPNEGCVLKSLIVKDSSGNVIQVTDGKFTMPTSDVTVTAEFEKVVYEVNVETDGNGTALAEPDNAFFGDTVTLSVSPITGYHFCGWESEDVTINGNSFTMPASDVTVKAVFEEDIYYSITVTNDGNGTASANATDATEGTDVTLTATANAGYHFKEWQSEDVTVIGNSFTMPASDVTVKAVFEEDIYYSIAVTNDGNGTASANATDATEGTDVTLTATANSGYHFKEWQSEDVTVIGNSFTMPASDVTVKAVFEKDTFSIAVTNDGNGIASANVTEASEGTDVTLTATANSGYHFKKWQSEDVTVIGNSFTMPAKDVTIKAVFEKNQVITPSPDPKPSGDSGQGGNAGGSTVPSNSGTSGGTEQTGDNGNSTDTGKTETEGTSEDTGKTEDTDNTDSKLPEGVQKVIGEMDDSKKGSKAAKLLEEIFAEENGQGASDDGTAGSEQETSGETASEQEDSQQKVTVSVVMSENSADEVESGSFKGGVFKNSEGKTVKNSIVESENNGKKYFVNEKGRKVRNAIVTDGANLYYCNKYGTMVTNKAVDLGDGRTVLAGEDGIIITKSDARVSVGSKSYITGENGIVVKDAITTISVKVKKNGKKVTVERTYITDENGVIQTGLVGHDGKFYITSKTGIVRKNRITTINGVKMYTDENGEVVKNATVKYGKVTYQADENGALTRVKKQKNKQQKNK